MPPPAHSSGPWLLPDQSQKSIVDELEQQTDRGAGIIGAAFIESLLLQALKSRMRLKTLDDKRAAKGLFDQMRPLSSFSAKIDLGLVLGLYRSEIRSDLHRIRNIRNEFAHAKEPRDFNFQKIRDACARFWLPHHLFIVDNRTGTTAYPSDARGRYILTTKLLIGLLYRAAITPQVPPDPLWD
jgi:hypothetical protein